MQDREKLYSYILEQKREGHTLYVFLDEIQHVKEYEKVVDSLQVKAGFDLYLTDFGFSYYLLHAPTVELQQLLENAVYFELLRRRLKVSTGKVDVREVDFVVEGDRGSLGYIQVAVSVSDTEKLNQELEVFKSIHDNYPKCILTLDEVYVPDHQGIKTRNVIDFLLEDN